MSIPEETRIATTGGPTLSRRTLAKGAAWSVPVVAAAAAAPVYACSIEPAPEVSLSRDTTTCSTTVTWSQVKQHTKYEIQYRVEGSSTQHTVSPSPVTGTSHTILNPTNVTEVRVRVYNPPCQSTWSNWISNRPAAPTGVNVSRYWLEGWDTTKITVTWNAVQGADLYEVFDGNTSKGTTATTSLEFRVKWLQTVNVTVRARVCGVWSPASGNVQARTNSQEMKQAELSSDPATRAKAEELQGSRSSSSTQGSENVADQTGTRAEPQSPASKPSASTPKPQASSAPATKAPAAPEPPVAPPADPAPAVEVVPEG